MKDSHPWNERFFERLSRIQRMQHIILMISFFTLVLTGLPVRYPEAWASSHVISFLGGFTMRAILHRASAIVLIVLTFYHGLYTVFTEEGHREFMALIPKPKDGFDALHMILFYLGFKNDKPRFDRYNFIEKFEYLAVGWGSVIMIGTGLVLWFEEQAMIILPKWALDVAKVVHSYEAVLAFLAIIIWHFYHVHLNPDVFPMSKIWLNGQVSETEMKEHHPIEYERITGEKSDVSEPAEVVPPSRDPAGGGRGWKGSDG